MSDGNINIDTKNSSEFQNAAKEFLNQGSNSPTNNTNPLLRGTASGRVMSEKVYYQTTTKNYSFLKMVAILKTLKITNCMFFLKLYDPVLMNVNPRTIDQQFKGDEATIMKARVLREISRNYYYYIREVILIPEAGGLVPYALHRGNLALTYCLVNNINAYLELPRQHGKTIGACAFYSWVYQFATTYSEIMYMNKKHDDSKLNLKRTKDMLENLPEYLRFKDIYDPETGKKKKSTDNREFMQNAKNNNRIVTKPSATSVEAADGLGRGCTQPCQWYDEFGFIPFNNIIFSAATPAQVAAAAAAARKSRPYSRLITTTPGDLTTSYGLYAKTYRDMSAEFMEDFYDWNVEDVKSYIDSNSGNNVVFIKFTYLELGKDAKWFQRMCKDLANDWEKIRREVLLEWIIDTSKSPFDIDELEEIKSQIDKNMKKHPKRRVIINKEFAVELYDNLELDSPMILSCDVSGGYSRDATTMIILSSKTTKVLGVFRNTRIGIRPFSDLIYSFVTKYAPNAIIAIERNSYGEGVISNLRATPIARNIYYEYKKDATVSRVKNGFTVPENRTVKSYGVWTDKNSRPKMMDLLRDRVDNHKDKIISPIIFEEMQNLEYRNGRIDHKVGLHDDTIMGWLIGLYVYYNGTNLHAFGIKRHQIPTDRDIIEDSMTEVFDLGDEKSELNYLANMRNISMPEFEKPIRQFMTSGGSEIPKSFKTSNIGELNNFGDLSKGSAVSGMDMSSYGGGVAFNGVSVKKSIMDRITEINEENDMAKKQLAGLDDSNLVGESNISDDFFSDMNNPGYEPKRVEDMYKYI